MCHGFVSLPLFGTFSVSSQFLWTESHSISWNMIDDILGCAKKTLEDYFVVPPGNIDYIPEEIYYYITREICLSFVLWRKQFATNFCRKLLAIKVCNKISSNHLKLTTRI